MINNQNAIKAKNVAIHSRDPLVPYQTYLSNLLWNDELLIFIFQLSNNTKGKTNIFRKISFYEKNFSVEKSSYSYKNTAKYKRKNIWHNFLQYEILESDCLLIIYCERFQKGRSVGHGKSTIIGN